MHSTFNEVVNLREKKNIIKYCITCIQVVHIIIKFFLKYNNISIVYLPYAIYFSTFKNTVFMLITWEFDFQNDFCFAIFYHYIAEISTK
jgi:hypothetical protein